jgi:peptidyl-prolyl cis-trans isomerase C
VPPVPLAARVNGAGLTLADYTAELQRLQAGLKESGKSLSANEQRQAVLQDLIDQMLLAQAAAQAGYTLSDADFQKRLDDVIAKSGGAPAFADWLARNFYTAESFRQALRLSLAATWQRDQIIAKAPTTAEQIHARQILVLNEDLATRLYIQLQAGTPFETLAIQMDPESGGELGWFPHGYLFLPEIEIAAFALQPGKYSAIIKTSYGYHIVYVIGRETNRPLAPDARLQAQRLFLTAWLEDRRAQSKVEILIQ